MAQQHEVFIVNPNLSVIGRGFFKTMEIQGTVCNLLDNDYSVLDLFPLVTTCHVQASHSLLKKDKGVGRRTKGSKKDKGVEEGQRGRTLISDFVFLIDNVQDIVHKNNG